MDTKFQNRINQHRMKHIMALAINYASDPSREHRLKEQKCKVCHYNVGTIAGQAFTAYTCAECGKESSHSNTDVPSLCKECAVKMQLCLKCGGTLNLDDV